MERFKFVFGLLVLAVVLSVSVEANAQRRLISAREFMLPLSNPAVKIYDKSRRVESTDETFANGAVVKLIMIVEEVQLPDNSRYYRKTTAGGLVSEIEVINVDYMSYTRKDNGPWTKVDTRGAGSGSGNGSGFDTSRECDQYSVEEVILNGRQVHLYEWILINRDTNELKFSESRRWLGEGSLPYREESVSGKLYPREETNRRIVTYEYDPAIKIEAPIK